MEMASQLSRETQLMLAVQKLHVALALVDGSGALALIDTPSLKEVAEVLRAKVSVLEKESATLPAEVKADALKNVLVIEDEDEANLALLAIVNRAQLELTELSIKESMDEMKADTKANWSEMEAVKSSIQESKESAKKMMIKSEEMARRALRHRCARTAFFFGLGSSLALFTVMAKQRGIRDQWTAFYGGLAVAHIFLAL